MSDESKRVDFDHFPCARSRTIMDHVDSIARNISLGLSGASIANAPRFEFAMISFEEILEDKRRKGIPRKERETSP